MRVKKQCSIIGTLIVREEPVHVLQRASLLMMSPTVALLGNGAEVTVLPLVEICFAALPPGALPLYSYAAKWLWDTPEHGLDILRCPTDLPADLARRDRPARRLDL